MIAARLAPVLAQATPEEVRKALQGVLARDEFHRRESLLSRVLRWLAEKLGLGGKLEAAASWLPLGILAFLALVLVFLLLRQLVRGLRGARRADATEGAGPDARARALRLRAEARTARAAGDLRLAMRLSFWALVVGLGARGDLRYRDSWTNRELLRRGSPSSFVRSLLGPLVGELEAKDFGREPTTEADVVRLEALCDEHLGPLAPVPAEGAA